MDLGQLGKGEGLEEGVWVLFEVWSDGMVFIFLYMGEKREVGLLRMLCNLCRVGYDLFMYLIGDMNMVLMIFIFY